MQLNSLYDPRPSLRSSERWKLDTSVTVLTRPAPQSNLITHYICGDTVRLSKELFPSFARDADKPNKGVLRLTVDARMLIVDMALVFDTCHIELKAETIEWTGLGEIQFTAEIPRKGGDSLKLLAQNLDLATARSKPFVFFTDNWSYLAREDEKPWPESNRRTVQIVAANFLSNAPRLRVNDGSQQFKDGLFKFVRDLTLDARVGLDKERSRLPYVLDVGTPSAEDRYQDELATRMIWPAEFAYKVQREHAKSPYDAEDVSFLKNHLIDPYLKRLPESQGLARLRLQETEIAIQNECDRFGRTRFYTPRITFAEQLKNFGTNLPSKLGLAQAWEGAILSAHGAVALDRRQLAMASQDLVDSERDADAVLVEVDRCVQDIYSVEQDIAIARQRIRTANDRLKKALDELIQANQDNAKLLQTTRILTAVCAIVSFYMPVAIVIGQAISVAGETIYIRNSGRNTTMADLEQALQAGDAFLSLATNLKDNWEKLQKTVMQKKRTSASVTNSARDFAKAFQEMYSALQMPAPAQINLNELQARDADFLGFLKDLAELQAKKATYLAKLADKQTDLSKTVLASTEARNAFDLVLLSKVRNDAEIAEQRSCAIQIRDRLFGDLASEAAELRRACSYHLAIPATDLLNRVPDSIRFFADRVRAPSEDFDPALSSDALQLELESQRLECKNNLDALTYFLQAAVQAQQARGFPYQPVPFAYFADYANPNAYNQVEFLDAINLSIGDQSKAMSARGEAVVASAYIPLDGIFPKSGEHPEKMIHAEVSNVIFREQRSMVGKRLNFRIVHPLYGTVIVDGKTYVVDMRRGDAYAQQKNFYTVWTEAGAEDTSDIETRYPSLRTDYMSYAWLPLRSKYFLEVELIGDPASANWDVIPHINSLEMNVYGLMR